MGITKAFLGVLSKANEDDLDRQTTEMCKKLLMDWIGVSIAGASHSAISALVNTVKLIKGPSQSVVIQKGFRADILNAALINGSMSHVLDFDDAHRETRYHCSAPLFAALLAVGEREHISGKRLLLAYAQGAAAGIRIGLALGKDYYDKGWHATPVLGRFSAALGVGYILNLKERQLEHTLGLAATQAGGIRSAFGTMAKSFHCGKAAMDGILSALLAKQQFTGPRSIFDNQDAFLRMFSSDVDSSRLTASMEHHPILDVSIKPYASCLVTHPTLDAVLTLRDEHGLNWTEVRNMRIEVAPLCWSLASNPAPDDALEAKFSVSFCSAGALIKGHANHHLFQDDFVQDTSIRKLMKNIEVKCNPSFKENEADVTVSIENGNSLNLHVIGSKGSPEKPMSFDDCINKFKNLTINNISTKTGDQIIAIVQNLELLNDVGELTALFLGE